MKIKIFLLFCLVCCIAFTLVACNENICQHRDADDNALCDTCNISYTDGKDVSEPPHEHTWGEWLTITAATCGIHGEQQQVCACGVIKTATIPATGEHVWGEWVIITAPTCSETGTQKHTCTCGATEIVAIPATGAHTYGAWEIVTPATCGAVDSQKHTCTCGATETVAISATGAHTYGAWEIVTPATCGAVGSQKHTCTCGASETVAISATGAHTWGEWETVTPATCGAVGSQKHTCTCGATETVAISATGAHTYGAWEIVTPATCGATGTQKHICTCGASETVAISATGVHTYGAWEIVTPATCGATGSKKHTCACGATEIIAILATGAHTWSAWEIKTPATCGATGERISTCLCGATQTMKIAATGNHTWGEWEIVTPATCGAVGSQKHTCTCGASETVAISATGAHTYGAWEIVTPATFTKCGEEIRSCICGSKLTRVIPVLRVDITLIFDENIRGNMSLSAESRNIFEQRTIEQDDDTCAEEWSILRDMITDPGYGGALVIYAKDGTPIVGEYITSFVLINEYGIPTIPEVFSDIVYYNGAIYIPYSTAVLMQSEHYAINRNMMTYWIYREYQAFVNTYKDTGWMQYIKGIGGNGLNTSMPLREQIYSQPTAANPETAYMTWFDYFAKSAKSSAETILTYCEYARSYAIELNDEEFALVDAQINRDLCGVGVGESIFVPEIFQTLPAFDVRAMVELEVLAQKASEFKYQELEDAVTDERVNLYYEENKSDLDVYVDYISYTFTTKFDAKDGDTDEIKQENANAWEKYSKDMERYNAIVRELESCTTAKEFCDKLEAFLAKSKDEGGEGMTATEAFLAQSGAHHFNYKEYYGAGDAIDAYLFNKRNPVSANSAKALTDIEFGRYDEDYLDENGQYQPFFVYSDATSTYTVVFVLTPPHRDEAKLQNMGHILFKTDTYKDLKDTTKLSGKAKDLAQRLLDKGQTISAENMAKELLLLMKEEGAITEKTAADGRTIYQVIDKDKFEAYGKDYTEDGNVFYEEVARGDMVAEMEAWLYNPNRQQGEISDGGIKTAYGYHVMFYNGASEKINWIEEAREQLATDDYEAWYMLLLENTFIDTENYDNILNLIP